MNSEAKYPDWFNMNLSELIGKSLKLGVIPFFQFLDKDTIKSGASKKYPSSLEQSPRDVIMKEIDYYERFIDKIERMDGIDKNIPAEKLEYLTQSLKKKIVQFQSAALLLLNSEPDDERSVATKLPNEQNDNKQNL